jgi:hypothetical protein
MACLKRISVFWAINSNNPELDKRMKSAILNFLVAGRTADVSENPADLKVTMEGFEA